MENNNEFKIINKLILAPNVKRLDILAETISQKALPGQFVVVIPQEKARWVTLTIVEADKRRGIISLIFDERDAEEKQLAAMHIEDELFSIMGPFGKPCFSKKVGHVICIAEGAHIADMLPICKTLKNAGNKVVGIIGAANKKALVFENQMRLFCHKLLITTDDGSYVKKGDVIGSLKRMLQEQEVKLVYAAGDVDTLKGISQITKQKGIKTLVHFTSNIFCGKGTCGSCRMQVGGQMILACQEGPEFDASEIDFDILRTRLDALGKTENKEDKQLDKKIDTETIVKKFFPGQFRS